LPDRPQESSYTSPVSPQSFVAKYEVGERRIDVVEFCEIADALKLDASALLSSIFMDRR